MKALEICIAVSLSLSFLSGQEPSDVEALKKGQPKEVQSFISRTFLCHHWAGEEPYDKARAEQIRRAIKRLRCDKLATDEARLRKKYSKNSKVLAALNAAKNL